MRLAACDLRSRNCIPAPLSSSTPPALSRFLLGTNQRFRSERGWRRTGLAPGGALHARLRRAGGPAAECQPAQHLPARRRRLRRVPWFSGSLSPRRPPLAQPRRSHPARSHLTAPPPGLAGLGCILHDLAHYNAGAPGRAAAATADPAAARAWGGATSAAAAAGVITAVLRTTTTTVAIIRSLASYEPVLGANMPAPLAALLLALLAVDPAARPAATAARAAVGALAAASVQWGS